MADHLNLDNARREDQRDLMKKIIAEGVCPFCRENIERFHPNPLLWETDYWIVTENAFPYEGADKQILFIVQRHIESTADLTTEEWVDLQHNIQRVLEHFNKKSGTILMRFGSTQETGATVSHLHGQLVISDINKKDYKPVMARVG